MKQIIAFLFQNTNRSFYYASEERRFNRSLENAKREHYGWSVNGGMSQ